MDNQVKLSLYKSMVRIRVFEQEARRLSRERVLPSRISSYTGQEAVAAGVSAHLNNNDQIGSTHRPIGHIIAKGSHMGKVMAELGARRSGFNKGKAGGYHLFDPKTGVLGANGIVGGSVPMTSGYALAHQIRKDGGVSVSYFGEGASNQGGVQETLNLAACWKLPIVFVCENSSPVEQIMLGHRIDYPQLNIDKVSKRASGFGMPGGTYCGWDVEEVYKVAGEAVKRAREGKGPTLLEFKVHNIGAPIDGGIEPQMDKKQFCPIYNYRIKLMAEGILTKEVDAEILSEEKDKAVKAGEFALKSMEPELLEAFTDVFTEDD